MRRVLDNDSRRETRRISGWSSACHRDPIVVSRVSADLSEIDHAEADEMGGGGAEVRMDG